MPDKSDDSGGDIRGRVYVLPIYNACQVTGAASVVVYGSFMTTTTINPSYTDLTSILGGNYYIWGWAYEYTDNNGYTYSYANETPQYGCHYIYH